MEKAALWKIEKKELERADTHSAAGSGTGFLSHGVVCAGTRVTKANYCCHFIKGVRLAGARRRRLECGKREDSLPLNVNAWRRVRRGRTDAMTLGAFKATAWLKLHVMVMTLQVQRDQDVISPVSCSKSLLNLRPAVRQEHHHCFIYDTGVFFHGILLDTLTLEYGCTIRPTLLSPYIS